MWRHWGQQQLRLDQLTIMKLTLFCKWVKHEGTKRSRSHRCRTSGFPAVLTQIILWQLEVRGRKKDLCKLEIGNVVSKNICSASSARNLLSGTIYSISLKLIWQKHCSCKLSDIKLTFKLHSKKVHHAWDQVKKRANDHENWVWTSERHVSCPPPPILRQQPQLNHNLQCQEPPEAGTSPPVTCQMWRRQDNFTYLDTVLSFCGKTTVCVCVCTC